MKQSLMKLVDVILRKMEEQPEVRQSESGLRSWLAGEGYSKRDIDAAMKLVGPRFRPQVRMEDYRPGPVRALSIFEEQKMSPEARSAFARLEFYGLIDPYEREMILDRLGHFDGEVGLEELDYLLSWVVCSARDYESQHTIYNVLEGETDKFH